MLSSSIVMAQMDQLDQLVASFKELKEQLLTVCEEHVRLILSRCIDSTILLLKY